MATFDEAILRAYEFDKLATLKALLEKVNQDKARLETAIAFLEDPGAALRDSLHGSR